jgi:ATP-dependent exoDNAse (exonuclease V) alpha subunit
VQLLLLGDLFQLPPVVQQQVAHIFSNDGQWTSPYFFSSAACKESGIRTFQLEHIYRQSDPQSVKILNRIRKGVVSEEDIRFLNHTCLRNPPQGTPTTTLVPNRNRAESINHQHLEKLPTLMHKYEASYQGEFRRTGHPDSGYNLPAPDPLCLKVGALVMFTKNDPQHRWVNGTVGEVKGLSRSGIKVEVLDEASSPQVCTVDREVWEQYDFQWSPAEKKMVWTVSGTYSQFPLMLAWAITIHKAQGKTLSRVIVDISGQAFAPGLTYVALSRTRSLNDIYLQSRLSIGDVRADQAIIDFYAKVASNPIASSLRFKRRT